MADFQVTFVQAGRDLKATNVAASDPTPNTYMEIGEGTTAPALADTEVETPFAPPIRFADPEGSAIGDAFTFLLNDSEARAYTLYEICWFSGGSAAAGGGTLLYRVVIASGLVKPLNARLHYPLVGRILGEDLDTLTFTNTIAIPSTPGWSDSVAGTVERASPAEAVVTSNHSNAKGLSVLRGWQQITAWWGWVSALGANLKASQAQAQAGSNNTKAMTPLRTREHFNARKAATSVVAAGTNDVLFATAAGVLASIRRNAVNGPKVVLQTTELGYASGGTGAQQGLAFPSPAQYQWLDSNKIEVVSFAPLDGCSAVAGGIHFDWNDANITSVDAIFTLYAISSLSMADPTGATDAVSTSDFMEDGDFYAAGGGTSSNVYAVFRSRVVRVPRNGYLLFTRATNADDTGPLVVEMEVLQVNT